MDEGYPYDSKIMNIRVCSAKTDKCNNCGSRATLEHILWKCQTVMGMQPLAIASARAGKRGCTDLSLKVDFGLSSGPRKPLGLKNSRPSPRQDLLPVPHTCRTFQ